MPTASKRDSFTGTLFFCGLLVIAFSAMTFLLFDWAHSGLLFCLGMAVCMVTCLASAMLGEKTSRGEFTMLAAGAAFFIWLILHNI